MASLAFSIAVSRSEIECSNPFFLSSAKSNSFHQYSFFESSSACSTLSVATISSIILMTFSNPIFFPCNARDNNSNCAFLGLFCMTCSSSVNALARKFRADTSICMKLEALGKVFLNSSNASSSFSTLMVSAKAANSSARVFTITSHSAFFFSQFSSKFARNFLSSIRASCVSPTSFFICAISTPKSPILVNLVSISLVNAITSFIFHLCNFHAQISYPCQLGFDLFGQCNHLFLFCSHQFFINGNCCLLCCGGLCKTCTHLIAHSFQDTSDLTALWCIPCALAAGQKCHQILAIVIHQHVLLA